MKQNEVKINDSYLFVLVYELEKCLMIKHIAKFLKKTESKLYRLIVLEPKENRKLRLQVSLYKF